MKRKLSFTTMGTPDRSLTEIIRLAKDCGFDGVDLRCSDHKGEVRPATPQAELRRVAEDFKKAGLSIPSLLCYPQVPADAADPWAVYESEVRRDLRIAHELGAHSIRVFTLKPTEHRPADEILRRTADAIRQALAADTTSVQVVVQNHKGNCDSIQSVTMAEKIGSPRFGLAYSPDHSVLCAEGDLAKTMERVLPWTREVYLSDLKEEGGKIHSVLPGCGCVPLREVVRFFDSRGFKGFYSFKWELIWNPHLEAPEVAMPHFIKFAQSMQ